ncbi:MAG: DNA/RNA nuclease SfsA [Vulcanimicrobiota bacterium]
MSPALALPPLLEARFLRRYKRFLCDARLADGQEVVVHCPNPGRMTSCLPSHGRILLTDHGTGGKRKLRYTWELSEVEGQWVVVNTLNANRVAARLLASHPPELGDYSDFRSEVKVGASRFDFCLETHPPTYLEVKQVTFKCDQLAAFPDAVTARGTRHLRELTQLRLNGHRCVMLYLVARADVQGYRPADEIDPAYAQAFRQAQQAGVEMLCYRLAVSPERLAIDRRLPLIDVRRP